MDSHESAAFLQRGLLLAADLSHLPRKVAGVVSRKSTVGPRCPISAQKLDRGHPESGASSILHGAFVYRSKSAIPGRLGRAGMPDLPVPSGVADK